MAEYTIRLGDERGRITEQVHAAATAEELRQRFTQAGFHVYSVKQKGLAGVGGGRRKVKLEAFLIFNAQFLTLIRAGLPIPNSLASLARQQKNENFRAQIENVVQRVKTGESLSSAFQAPMAASVRRLIEPRLRPRPARHHDRRLSVPTPNAAKVQLLCTRRNSAALPYIPAILGPQHRTLGPARPCHSRTHTVNTAQIGVASTLLHLPFSKRRRRAGQHQQEPELLQAIHNPRKA